MPNHKGWFSILDVQDGDRTVEQQLKGLESVAHLFKGAHVLDLGSAEGLIGRHCVDAWGAASVDGITCVQYEIDEAQRQCAGRPMRFFNCDLRKADQIEALGLRERYDVVLLLSILHKMKEPVYLLTWAATIAASVVIRLPSPVIVDKRSDWKPLDVPGVMRASGWDLTAEPETCIEPVSGKPEWMGVFMPGNATRGHAS